MAVKKEREIVAIGTTTTSIITCCSGVHRDLTWWYLLVEVFLKTAC